MKIPSCGWWLLLLPLGIGSVPVPEKDLPPASCQGMIIRLTEIEIDPDQREAYQAILREEAAASVRSEPGVISIYPMYRRDQPAQVRILEIYADQAAYEAHLQSPHFKHYKTATQDMVRSLHLVDMAAMDEGTMAAIFRKLP